MRTSPLIPSTIESGILSRMIEVIDVSVDLPAWETVGLNCDVRLSLCDVSEARATK